MSDGNGPGIERDVARGFSLSEKRGPPSVSRYSSTPVVFISTLLLPRKVKKGFSSVSPIQEGSMEHSPQDHSVAQRILNLKLWKLVASGCFHYL